MTIKKHKKLCVGGRLNEIKIFNIPYNIPIFTPALCPYFKEKNIIGTASPRFIEPPSGILKIGKKLKIMQSDSITDIETTFFNLLI